MSSMLKMIGVKESFFPFSFFPPRVISQKGISVKKKACNATFFSRTWEERELKNNTPGAKKGVSVVIA